MYNLYIQISSLLAIYLNKTLYKSEGTSQCMEIGQLKKKLVYYFRVWWVSTHLRPISVDFSMILMFFFLIAKQGWSATEDHASFGDKCQRGDGGAVFQRRVQGDSWQRRSPLHTRSAADLPARCQLLTAYVNHIRYTIFETNWSFCCDFK